MEHQYIWQWCNFMVASFQ